MISWLKKLLFNYKYQREIEDYADLNMISDKEAKKICEEWGKIRAQSHGTPSPCVGCMVFQCSRRGKKLIYCKDASD